MRQVDALVELNELIGSFNNKAGAETPNGGDFKQQAMLRQLNKLIEAFTSVMNSIFSFPPNEIPLRFTKYFITIVNKTCSQKDLMKEVGYD